jgi:hypothetical protein
VTQPGLARPEIWLLGQPGRREVLLPHHVPYVLSRYLMKMMVLCIPLLQRGLRSWRKLRGLLMVVVL